MSSSQLDCLCAGIIVADHVCAPVPHMPVSGELVLSERMELTLGGCAANVAVSLTKLGKRTSVVGCVGRDPLGRFARESLEASSVDCRGLIESPTRDTSGTLVVNVAGEDRRFIHSIGANGELTSSAIDAAELASCRILYLGGYCLMPAFRPEQVAKLFAQARAAGVTTVLDVVIPDSNDYRQWIEPVLPQTDLFLPNDDESLRITGLDDPLRQSEWYLRAGARSVVVTCGHQGAVYRDAKEILRTKSYEVPFVDGTGSGDAFTAGFLFGLLDGCDVRTCLQFGSALGASCVRAAGATTGTFNAAELRDFVSRHPFDVRTEN